METTCVLRTTKQVELSPTKTKYIVKHAIQQAAPIQSFLKENAKNGTIDLPEKSIKNNSWESMDPDYIQQGNSVHF